MTLRIHGSGGAASPPPPALETYGPLLGVDPTRNNAGPKTVIQGTNGCPTGGTSFSSSLTVAQLQALIDSSAANTVFVASATGAYTNFRDLQARGQHPRFVFPGVASSYSITGTGAGTQIGFDSWANGGMEVYGGTWSQYGNSQGSAAYSSPFVFRGPSVLQDAVVTLSNNGGSIDHTGSSDGTIYRFTRNQYLSNTMYGQSGVGVTGSTQQAIVEYCIFDDNNTGGRLGWLQNDPGGNAGATKYLGMDGMIVRYNWFKNNYGFGLWYDGSNRNISAHDNVFENNLLGVFYEISFGGTIIEHNYFTGNGGLASWPYNAGQINISCSPCDASAGGPNVRSEIRYNDVDSNRISGDDTGIVLFNHVNPHPLTMRTRNWYVHDNRIWIRNATVGRSRNGLGDICGAGNPKEGDIGTSPNAPGADLFDWNEYHVASMSVAYWRHDTANQSPGDITWELFRARGHEANGTRVII